MCQRAGIAGALSIEPKILLMQDPAQDEPFSAVDALTRGTLQDEVRRICKFTGQTVVMITHEGTRPTPLLTGSMTTGPAAMVAETVENPLPAHRRRTFRDETPAGDDPRHPPRQDLRVESMTHEARATH